MYMFDVHSIAFSREVIFKNLRFFFAHPLHRTVGQRCYGHIDFITKAEIKSYDFSI